MLFVTVGIVLNEKETHGSLLPKLAYDPLRFDNEKLRRLSGQPFSCREAAQRPSCSRLQRSFR